MNTRSIEKGTGVSWENWLAFLDKYKNLEHPAMAKLINQHIINHGKSENPGWWAQSVTVEYEKHTGRRQAGVEKDGTRTFSVNRRRSGNIDAVFDEWCEHVKEKTSFNDVDFVGEPRVTKTDNWRYYRIDLSDGTKVTLSVAIITDTTSALSLTHERIKSVQEMHEWKSYWQSVFNQSN